MNEQQNIIVAIELGSSKIAGIAGKMKDGNMQILAYAEEKSNDCVKRGVVYNIEKTTQNIKSVVAKLETTLKMKITQTYIGLGGQSIRSIKSVEKTNLITPTHITQAHIDELTDESHAVPYDDYELIGFFTQGFTVDNVPSLDPVGVMGTVIEGEYLNIIANRRNRSHIITSFENLGLHIADFRLADFELANNILTDTEKRSGVAMVDFGDQTTTIVVLKNNVVRQFVTLPLGINNIRQDLCDLQIEENEADAIMKKYANWGAENEPADDNEQVPTHTTSDGRQIEVSKIQFIIGARLNEILVNVDNLLESSDYADKLLGGVVITGGGALMGGMEKACASMLKMEKVRVAKKVIPTLIKNSVLTHLSLDNPTTCTIVSLLLGGHENCVGEAYKGPDMFRDDEKERQIALQRQAAEALQKEENAALEVIENAKQQLRVSITQMQAATKAIEELKSDDKHLIAKANKLIEQAQTIITDDYQQRYDQLSLKDRYNQALREAKVLTEQNETEMNRLDQRIKEANKKFSAVGRIGAWFRDLLEE